MNGRLSGPEQVSIARRVLLTDGGVYDNLGLEPVWKSHAIVLCSDGGKPSQIEPDSGSAIAARVSRTVEIFSDQALSLRKRWLIQQFQTGALGGAYWGLRTDISGYARHREGFRGALLSLFAGVRTDLDAFSDDEQRALINHGWLLADAALESYARALVEETPTPSGPPFPDMLSPNAVQSALSRAGG